MSSCRKSVSEFLPLVLAALLVTLIAAAICTRATGWAEPECFDGGKAFAHLRALVEIGPRPPDSPGAAKAQRYISAELGRLGIEVRKQAFIARTPLGPKKMENIIGVIPGRGAEIIIVGTHYDTKLIEGFPFVGANDGGSGTAALLELARRLSARRGALTIWLVFFDGEEALVSWGRSDGLYGSRHMVALLSDSGEIAKVKAMILLDMVGDSHLSIEWETNSTRWLKETVWSSAKRLGCDESFTMNPRRIFDDHVPFLECGIPSIDIIDFHYGPLSRTNEYWHTSQDTLDNVSPASLKIIGDVVLESLPEITKRILSPKR